MTRSTNIDPSPFPSHHHHRRRCSLRFAPTDRKSRRVCSPAEQKRGYKDQWPFSVRIYKDEATGKPKGDCIIKYEEPNSAHAALRWFDGIEFKGGKIGVAMAAKPSLNNRY